MGGADYQRIIVEAIHGLPENALSQIAEFAINVRHAVHNSEPSDQRGDSESLRAALKQLSAVEERHLEQEFEQYDKLYPRE